MGTFELYIFANRWRIHIH